MKILGNLFREKPVDVQLKAGEQKKVKIDGEKVMLKSDGKLEPHIVDKLTSDPELAEKGLITDIKDPRIQDLLKNKDKINAVIAQEKDPEKVNGKELGEHWKVNKHTRITTEKAGPGEDPLYSTEEIGRFEVADFYNPVLNDSMFSQNKVEIGIGHGGYEGEHIVSLSARTGNDYQDISALFNPETGQIREDTITEWIVHDPKHK